jgi:PAS domain S-box-containing protein
MSDQEQEPAGSRTMRIDIDPALLPPLPEPPRRVRRRAAATPAFVARRRERVTRDTPYDKLLESVYDGVFITDRNGVIVDFNDRAVEFFLLDEDRLLGVPLIELISGADESLIETIHANLLHSRYTLIEARCRRADGTSFPAEIATNEVDLDQEGQLCFFVRDITLRRQALDALEAAVERLQAHDRARMEFVSNVSHELRTPLTSMIYAVGNMLRGVVGPLPEKAVRYLERLESDCRRLLATVNDILDLRQLENGTLTLAKSRTPLGQLVQTAMETLRVQADAKRQRLTVESSARECFALCDPQKLERVLINVIGNAVKFTPEEGTVTVRAMVDPSAPEQAIISVCDNGIGIPKDAIIKVTQRYFKVGDHPNGSGLGLSISREIVELHGGSLTIESPVPGTERGTAVYVRLPIAQPPTVLVVTGDLDASNDLRRMIESRGYGVVCATTGQEALIRCFGQPVDMLVLDLRLPDMDATELILQVRNDRRTQRLPAIALARETLSRPTTDILQRFGIPALPAPWREADILNRLGVIASGGRSAAPTAASASSNTRAGN